MPSASRHASRHLFQLAQQRALEGFGVLIGNMLSTAAGTLAQAARGVSADEQAALAGARSLVGFEAQQLGERMERHFVVLLERAMQTMHTDLRADLRNVNIDQLSLLDDAVMVRQIGVDRLVLRLRDAEQLSFGRLNVIIAQLHGVSEVRERENPFRPYLLARALYDAVGEMVRDEARLRILFDHLGAAMAAHMGAYYGPVLAAFEQRGVFGRLAARASQATRAERERLAWQRAAEQAAKAGGDAIAAATLDDPQHAARLRLLPRVRSALAGAPSPGSAFPDIDDFDAAQSQQTLQTLVRSLGAPRQARLEPAASTSVGPALLAALRAAQQDNAAGAEPLQLASRIAAAGAGRDERQRLDLAALLFEFMLGDGMLDPGLRAQLARLFAPFARLALEQPAMLRQPDHPARRLVDRIGALAASIEADMPGRSTLDAALGAALDALLRDFDGDPSDFARAADAIDAAAAAWLPCQDADVAACAAALDDADTVYLRHAAAAELVEPLLDALRTDARIAAFIRDSWIAVLARSSIDEPGHADLLAELVWSAQQKLDAAEHGALMRLLPNLVKRLRQGLARLDLSEAESKATLDQLVAVHMEVLGNAQSAAAGALGLDALRRHFAPVDARRAAPPGTSAWPDRIAVGAALARHGAQAAIQAVPVGPGDDALLAPFKPGIAVEFFEGGVYESGRLLASGGGGGAWLFSVAGRPEPLVLLRGALLAALDADTVRTREYAPLTERAIDALTSSVATLAA